MSETKNLLDAVAVLMGIERHEDGADPEAFLRAVEGAQNAAVLAGFLRGQRSARAAHGQDVDSLPEPPPHDGNKGYWLERTAKAEKRSCKLEEALLEIATQAEAVALKAQARISELERALTALKK